MKFVLIIICNLFQATHENKMDVVPPETHSLALWFCENVIVFYTIELCHTYNRMTFRTILRQVKKWCQCLDKKVQDFSVVKQNSIMVYLNKA